MPRFGDRGDRGDRHGMGTRLLVKDLSSRTMARHLDDLFSRYGRVRDVDVKQKFGFVEFYDPRDANVARDSLSGRDVKGCRITVRFVKGAKRCKVGDWKNKFCRGHIQRNCPNSPKKLSDSCSPSPCRGLPSPHKGRIRSRSFSRSRSYRSKRSRSPRQGRSPKHEKGSHVASSDEKSPDKDERQASGGSFRSWSRCPIKEGETKSPTNRDARSRRPYEENGRHRKWMRPK